MRRRRAARALFLAEQLECRTLLAMWPAAGEFRVNTVTASDQSAPAVASDASGKSVVVWASASQDGSGYGVYAQRYDAAGAPQGGEFRVNTFTAGNQYNPTVAMDADGDFVVIWESLQDGSGYGIYGQRYSSAGVAQGAEFRVNTNASGTQDGSAVAMDAAGDFVVIWGSPHAGGGRQLYEQRYNAAGTALGTELRINTASLNNNPNVAMNASGNYVICWPSTQGGVQGIYARALNIGGGTNGPELLASTTATGQRQGPAVAVENDGDFVITWNSDQGGSLDVYAQRYNAANVRQGSEFKVNSYTSNADFIDAPSIAVDSAGDFFIAWASDGRSDGSWDIYARQYNGSGIAQGAEVRINASTSDFQFVPSIASNAAGDSIVAWQRGNGNGDVYARQYRLLGAIGVIGGRVFNDADADGVQDAGESGVAGVEAMLYTDTGAFAGSVITGADGSYRFDVPVGQSVRVQFIAPAGNAFSPQNVGANDALDSDANAGGLTDPYTLTTAGQQITTVDAGVYVPASVSGVVFRDANANGIREAGELGQSGWIVYVDLNGNNARDAGEPSSVSDANGAYLTSGLAPGTQTVRLVDQPNWLESSQTVTLASGQTVTGLDLAVRTSAPNQPPASLFPARQFGSPYPNAVLSADLDGDGDADLVVVSDIEDNIAVLRSNGDGTFATRVTYLVNGGYDPNAVTAADIDGDGDLDLAVANRNVNSITVFRNNGNGTFGNRVHYTGGGFDIASADLDGDGDADLAVAASAGVHVFRNNGNGTFATAVTTVVGSAPRSLNAADFDGDGDADIAVTNTGNDNVSILKNNGNATFAPRVNYTVGDSPISMESADLDGDGDRDLAIANSLSDNVSVLRNNGNGTFAAATNYAVGDEPLCVYIADLDGDGRGEIATSNNRSNNVSILHDNGTATFAAAVNYYAGQDARALTSADFDLDGALDLLVASGATSGSTVVLLRGDGDGTVRAPVNYAAGDAPLFVGSADLDGDGDVDLAVANQFGDTVSIHRGNGDGTFAPAVNYTVGDQPSAIALADIDGDGDVDLAVANFGSAFASILKNNGNGTFAVPVNLTISATGSGMRSIVAADLDGDSDADLAVGTSTGSVDLVILRNNGNGTFAAPVSYTGGGGTMMSIAVADLDGDGDRDLAVANNTGNNVSVFRNNGNATFAAAVNYSVFVNAYAVAAADLDGDGDVDLAVAHGSGVAVLRNNGNATFAPRVTYNLTGAVYLAAADLDGDGDNDVAAVSQGTAGIAFLKNPGTGIFPAAELYLAGFTASALAIADVNGDGWRDLVTANLQSDTISILLNQSPLGALPFIESVAQDVDGQNVSFTFNTPLAPGSLAITDLQATNLTTGVTTSAIGVTLSPDGLTARFTLSSTMANGNYVFRIPAGAVTAASGAATNVDAVISGDDIFILAGDANRDRHVDALDQAILSAHLNQSGTFANGDFNYDGTINSLDQEILDTNWHIWLPPQGPLALPTTSGADAIALRRSGSELHMFVGLDVQPTYRIPLGAVTAFSMDGGGGTDSLTLLGGAVATAATFNAASVVLDGVTIAHANFETMAFDGGPDTSATDTLAITGGPMVRTVVPLLLLQTLSITGVGALDLVDHDMIVANTPRSTIESYIATANNFGGWDGPGGIFSTTAKNNPAGNTTLGLLSGTEFNDNNGGLFNGIAIGNSDVVVKYTYFGDVDFNGSVDVSDYNLIDFGFSNHFSGWANGDADWSGGATDVSDYNLIDFAFATQTTVL